MVVLVGNSSTFAFESFPLHGPSGETDHLELMASIEKLDDLTTTAAAP